MIVLVLVYFVRWIVELGERDRFSFSSHLVRQKPKLHVARLFFSSRLLSLVRFSKPEHCLVYGIHRNRFFNACELILLCFKLYRRHHFFTQIKSRFVSRQTQTHLWQDASRFRTILLTTRFFIPFFLSLTLYLVWQPRTQEDEPKFIYSRDVEKKKIDYMNFISIAILDKKHWRCQKFLCHI